MNNQLHSKSRSYGRLTGKQNDLMSTSEFYDCERGIGKKVDMICFHLKSGLYRAFATSLFDEINFQPHGEIDFYARFCNIKIKGRNMQPLYLHLVQHRVKEIRDFSKQVIDDGSLEIECIQIHSDYE